MSQEEPNHNAPQRLISWTPLLDACWKLGLFISIAFYTVGLVISNLHAQRFGRYSLGLDKAEYIIVGFLWAFLATVGFIMFLQLRRGCEGIFFKAPTTNRYVRWVLGIIAIVVATSFLMLLFSVISIILQVGDFIGKNSWVLFGVVLGTGAAIDTFARHLVSLTKEGPLSWTRFTAFHTFASLLQYGWYLPAAVIVYSLSVFPLIPAAFGGGALQKAEIFLKPEGQQLFKDMKVSTAANGSIGTWYIVVELPDAMVITDTTTPNVAANTPWVRKDRIEAMMYSKTKSGSGAGR
jgi:hypothetical protein